MPPTFGAFARRTYASDNPLIGYPLAYQYLTSLRPDALPATADELLRKRSLGWLLRYSVGNQSLDRGVPLVSAFRWDTGVQAHAGATNGLINATASVTTGTLSNPLFHDDNSGRQLAGRVEVRPVDRPDRRHVGRARTVRRATPRRAWPRPATGTPATSRRRRGAPTSSTRAATIWSGSRSIVSAWRLPAVRRRRSLTSRSARCRRRSKAATSSRPAFTPRRAAITSASAISSERRRRRRGTRR